MAIQKITMAAARKNAGLTQRALAKLCGVSENTVIRWEQGKKDPTISQARRIGEICGIHYDDIIFLPANYGLTVDNSRQNRKEA